MGCVYKLILLLHVYLFGGNINVNIIDLVLLVIGSTGSWCCYYYYVLQRPDLGPNIYLKIKIRYPLQITTFSVNVVSNEQALRMMQTLLTKN